MKILLGLNTGYYVQMYDPTGGISYFQDEENCTEDGIYRMKEVVRINAGGNVCYAKMEKVDTLQVDLNLLKEQVGLERYYDSRVLRIELDSSDIIILEDREYLEYFYMDREGVHTLYKVKATAYHNYWVYSHSEVKEVGYRIEDGVNLDIGYDTEDKIQVKVLVGTSIADTESHVEVIDDKVLYISATGRADMYIKLDIGRFVKLPQSQHLEIHNNMRTIKDVKYVFEPIKCVAKNKLYKRYDFIPPDKPEDIPDEVWLQGMCFYRYDRVLYNIDLPCIIPEQIRLVTPYIKQVQEYCSSKYKVMDKELRELLSNISIFDIDKYDYKENIIV